MSTESARQRSLSVYLLHMGGPDGDSLEWQALKAQRFEARLKAMGVRFVTSAWSADVAVVTGLLLKSTLDDVLRELSNLPQPSLLIAAGDCAINGGRWAHLQMAGISPHPLSYYADVHISVPGNPPTPQALIAALAAASERLRRPTEKLSKWPEE